MKGEMEMKLSTGSNVLLASTLALSACIPGPCERSICGCWEDAVVPFEATILDASSGTPVSGIEVRCDDETEIRSTSDGEGGVVFEVETRSSPGCGIETCSTLGFSDPQNQYQDQSICFFEASTVELEPIE